MKPSYIKNTLLKIIFSMQDDLNLFVKHPGIDFTRNRRITFADLILFLLTLEDHSMNRELRRFFKDCDVAPPTKSVMCQQRDKLNDFALPYLLSAFNDAFSFKKKFHGYHLLACDGSDINVPSFDDA